MAGWSSRRLYDVRLAQRFSRCRVALSFLACGQSSGHAKLFMNFMTDELAVFFLLLQTTNINTSLRSFKHLQHSLNDISKLIHLHTTPLRLIDLPQANSRLSHHSKLNCHTSRWRPTAPTAPHHPASSRLSLRTCWRPQRHCMPHLLRQCWPHRRCVRFFASQMTRRVMSR